MEAICVGCPQVSRYVAAARCFAWRPYFRLCAPGGFLSGVLVVRFGAEHPGFLECIGGHAVSKSRKKSTLFDLSREPFQPEDRDAHIAEMLTGGDRPSALVGCAILDANLKLAIGARLVMWSAEAERSLFYDNDAPMSSFSAKIKFGRALGIYGPKVHSWLDVIRRIRNTFAHSVRPLTFSNDYIEKECLLLPEMALNKSDSHSGIHPMRERYIAICFNVSFKLEEYAETYRGSMVKLFLQGLSGISVCGP